MPRFVQGEVAETYEKTPGKWLVRIPRKYKLGKEGAERNGIDTIDNRTGQPRKSQKGDEMWDAAAEIIDDTAGAPKGAIVLGLHMMWGGKGYAATRALLKSLGYPVDQWNRETDPAKVPEITPEHFYDRPFVLDCGVNEQGFLEPNGFNPYFPATAARGPKTGAAAQSKKPPKGEAAHAPGSAGASAGGPLPF
jgi:hypothetical protein